MKRQIPQRELETIDHVSIAADGINDALTSLELELEAGDDVDIRFAASLQRATRVHLEQRLQRLFEIEAWDAEKRAIIANYIAAVPATHVEDLLRDLGIVVEASAV